MRMQQQRATQITEGEGFVVTVTCTLVISLHSKQNLKSLLALRQCLFDVFAVGGKARSRHVPWLLVFSCQVQCKFLSSFACRWLQLACCFVHVEVISLG
jgi:hypothetical protein